MTAKEIKNYIDMMKHTLNRRMDNQEGKDWLIDKYCNDMQKGMDAIEELEAIKSADGGEAIKILQKLATIPLNIDDNHWTTLSTQDDYKSLENYILKSQAQDQELQELKLTNAIAVTNIRSVLKDCRISKIKRYCIDDELKEICPTIYKNDGDAILETIKNFAKEVKSDE